MLLTGGTAAAATPALFARIEQRGALGKTTAHATNVQVDRAALAAAIRTGALRIDLPDGASLVARTLRSESMRDGSLTWAGVVSLAKQDRTVLITQGRDAVFASLVANDGTPLELETRRGVTRLIARDPRLDANTLFARAGAKDYFIPQADTPATPARASSLQAPAQAPALAAAAAPLADLVLGYNQGLVERYGSKSAALTRLSYLTSVVNQALQDSQVAGRYRLVGTVQVDYPDTSSNADASTALADVSGSSPLQKLRDLRRATGADMMVLVRPFLTPEHGNCGLAPVNGSNLGTYTTAASLNGRAVVSDGTDDNTGFFCNVTTLAHELGHAMGLQHEIEVSPNPGPFPYTYGWRMTLDNGRSFHTLMAYGVDGQKSLPYYSNPNIFYCGGTPCGTPDQADQARALGQTMPVVAAFNQPGDPVSDFDANGHADLTLQSATEMAFIMFVSGKPYGSNLPFSAYSAGRRALPAGARIAAYGDFDGDHRSELVLEAPGNQILFWTTDLHGDFVQTRAPDRIAGDTLLGAADLNGDGRDDLLFLDPVLRKFTVWRMNGASRTMQQTYATAAGATLAAVGDFDGDLRIDLMWSDPAGNLTFWKNTTTGFTQTASQSYAAGWAVVGAGDLDNDGRADLVLENRTSGQIDLWLMNGATRLSTRVSAAPAGYRVVSVDRFSGATASILFTSDARDGLLWENNGDGSFHTESDLLVFPGSSRGSYPSGWSMVPVAPRRP
ncbi:hypothetical protein A7A76_09510 [Lysobacter enzymogenes]|nr:hypothetical protein [Lysobacter enzymogenes]